MTSRLRGDGKSRARRTRKNVAAIIAAAKGMSLVWLNMAPYQAPHRLKASAAIRPARGPATSRAVAAAAAMPPIPVIAQRI